MPETTRLLFVCLGNICRSPLAKGVFVHLAQARGVMERFEVDSCGTGDWHVGSGADPRTVAIARKHGVRFDHTARQLDASCDFENFDLLLAMDRANAATMLRRGAPPGRVKLLRAFESGDPDAATDPPEVPDPYTGDERHFQDVYDIVHRACNGLLDHLLAQGPRPRG